jgi:hypothetical protein
MKRKRSLWLLLIVLITACTPRENAQPSLVETPQVVASPTLLASETLIPTATVTFTPAPTTTATLIPLSEEELAMLNQVYRILLFIQIDMRMLDEIAEKVQAGELVGIETVGALMVLATVVNEVDTAIQSATPPDLIKDDWEAALQAHEETKQLITDWVNEEMDSSGIRAEAEDKLGEIDQLMESVEKTLAEYYGFDQEEMRRSREAVVESVNEIFATPEP